MADEPQPQPDVDSTAQEPQAGDEEGLVERTESLAEQAIERFKPDVRQDLGRAAAFFASFRSWTTWAILVWFVATSVVGTSIVLVGVPPVGALPDWYMHGVMYVVLLCFLLLYAKAHVQDRRFARGFFALLSLALHGFFAWVLVDLVPMRSLVAMTDGSYAVVERPPMPALWAPAVMLMVSAFWLVVHWIVLARFRKPDAVEPSDGEPEESGEATEA